MKLVIIIKGGMVQYVLTDADQPVHCVVVDYDTYGFDEGEVTLNKSNGYEYLGYSVVADLAPDYVNGRFAEVCDD